MRAVWWLYGQVTKEVEDVQRRELRLPRTSTYATQRILQGGWLEIQAYDEVCFPGLAAEWKGRRPFVGALTMQLPTEADDEVASWIAAGKPPIYFGFGSTPVQTPDETVAMIAAACAELGERALIYSGGSGDRLSDSDHVKLVGLVNYATILPTCRAAVHHGGAGTTAAGLRAGIPMLILWDVADQPLWAAQVKRLKVGSARRFSRITRKSLLAELRTILDPQYAARAREIAPRMTKPTASITSATDLLEGAARQKPVCFSASTRCV
jgi:UDP:flavonoid glycosyltransferase YjiC (YdhE family)